MGKSIATFIFTKILGWKMIGTISPEVKKCIIIGAPHTSWHDFYISILFRSMINLPISYMAKKALFDSFFGFLFKWTGGIPVDRTKNKNIVDTIAEEFNNREEFKLAISPEGTRSKVEKWKTGFYFIAKKAKIPVVMMTFDFGKKQIKVSEPYFTTDDQEKDFHYFHNFYDGVIGKKTYQS